jgi:hypothetical protein
MNSEKQHARFLQFADQFSAPVHTAWAQYFALRDAQRTTSLSHEERADLDQQEDRILDDIGRLSEIEETQMTLLFTSFKNSSI